MTKTALGWSLSVVLFLLCSTAQSTTRDPGEYFFDQTFGDFSEELATAKDEGKKGILIMFELDDCPFCHRMKQTVLNQSEVQDYFKEHFMIFSVDIEGPEQITDFKGDSVTEEDFAFKQFRVRATPVFGFFDLDGKMIARYTGATSSVEEFLWLGQYVADGEYQKTSFTRYKRERKKAKGSR